jgi:imidazole glycerol-phosphate synthase subunit HisH
LSTPVIGVVDYGVGNHASVIHSLRDIGFRVRVSDQPEVLDAADVLLLPGVGAFPSAMKALHQRGLVNYLQQQARKQRSIVGICLGMQLLTSGSYELEYTEGLDLIPGSVLPLNGAKWHIGWNTLECVGFESPLQPSDRQVFYFNHSFCYQGPTEFHIGLARYPEPFACAIRRGNIIGVQFHPEKSQQAGKILLQNLINGLLNA